MSVAGIGVRARRTEDHRLLKGKGVYVDDIQRPDMLHMAIARSPHAHALIRSLHYESARNAEHQDELEKVWTAADLEGEVGQLSIDYCAQGQKMNYFPVLPKEKVVYVGQPVAAVLASSRYEAEDKLDRVRIEYEPLPILADVNQALREDAPLLYPEWGENVANRLTIRNGDVDEIFSSAPCKLEETFTIHRSAGMPLEGRGIVAEYDERERRLTVWVSTQASSRFRGELARVLRLNEGDIRVFTPDVGGGFGLKLHIYPEEILACWLAVKLRRPIKYVEDRQEHFLATVHAREQTHQISVAYTQDGKILAIRDRIVADAGAHLHTKGSGPVFSTGRMLPGPYKIPACDIEVISVVTNKVPAGAYRGFGQPQAAVVIEQMIDRIASTLKLDPLDVRYRNLIQPEEMPFTSITGMNYDSGNYPAVLNQLSSAIDYYGWRRQQVVARGEGVYLGIGVCSYVETTGFGPARVLARLGRQETGYETVRIKMDATGAVTLFTGLDSNGQGHETAFAQLCAEILQLPLSYIRVVSGDTDSCPYSGCGTAASRGAPVGGGAVLGAAEKLRDKLLKIAAHIFEVRVEDLELAPGVIAVRGYTDRRLTIEELARVAYRPEMLPPGMDPGLECTFTYDPPDWTYANAASAAVVQVDPELKTIELKDFTIVHDSGVIINPLLAEGQVVGGLVQGIGEALWEELVYDNNGQLLTASFMDYLLPTANELVNITLDHWETPSPFSPGGIKGLGEGGTIAAPAAIMNAVADALRPLGIFINELPITPARLHEWMKAREELTG